MVAASLSRCCCLCNFYIFIVKPLCFCIASCVCCCETALEVTLLLLCGGKLLLKGGGGAAGSGGGKELPLEGCDAAVAPTAAAVAAAVAAASHRQRGES